MRSMKNTCFQGKATKIRLISNNQGFGPWPEPGQEVEQHLSVSPNGRVWLSGYGMNREGGLEKLRSLQFKIDKEFATNLCQRIGEHFAQPYEEMIVMDVGSWSLEITNTTHQGFRFFGPLCTDAEEFVAFSNQMRYSIRGDLMAFDGAAPVDQVMRILIDYHRISKFKPKVPISDTIEYVTWDYTESMNIDRLAETVTYHQRIGSGCDVTRIYHVEEGVSAFLDDFDADILFRSLPEPCSDAVPDPFESKDYKIVVEFLNGPTRIVNGLYDKDGLPDDWAEFIKSLFDFIGFYSSSDLADPELYNKRRRRETSIALYSVEFEEDGKRYYYLSENEEYKRGDAVVVPAGDANQTKAVRIVDIEYITEDEAPFPLDRIKQIIGRADIAGP